MQSHKATANKFIYIMYYLRMNLNKGKLNQKNNSKKNCLKFIKNLKQDSILDKTFTLNCEKTINKFFKK